MRRMGGIGRQLLMGALVAAGLPIGSHAAHASKGHAHVRSGHGQETGHAATHRGVSRQGNAGHDDHGHGGRHAANGHRHDRHGAARLASADVASEGGYISCVPFARAESGIRVAGNAADWWDNAAGTYARGHRPEVGSVLNFRANGHMRLGHVAVVSAVGDSRHVAIDHANWAGPGARRGGISRDITVVDVSPENDWSAVRVELGHSGGYGSIYPTYGFIYARSEGNDRFARAASGLTTSRGMQVEMRQAAVFRPARAEEVAEAPAVVAMPHAKADFSLSAFSFSDDAPNRSLR